MVEKGNEYVCIGNKMCCHQSTKISYNLMTHTTAAHCGFCIGPAHPVQLKCWKCSPMGLNGGGGFWNYRLKCGDILAWAFDC